MSAGRSGEIVRVSLTGIVANLLLSAGKAAAGLAAHSTTVVLDAVNNLSDALSSSITIIGTRIAGREADREHPYGHGRVEYITSSVIALIVMAAGLTSLREAVTKIISPAEVKYTAVSLTVIAAGILGKLFLGRYFLRRGRELASTSLSASGTDALGDAVISSATFVSAAVNMLLGINIEGWLGSVISVFIFRAGLEILTEALDNIIGVRIDSELSKGIKAKLCSYEGVLGAYDLVYNSYGPDRSLGSVHIELCDTMTVRELDELTRRIIPAVYKEFGVLLTIGVYASNTYDETARKIKEAVRLETEARPQVIQMHGFYADTEKKEASFDIIVDFDEPEPERIAESIRNSLSAQFPDYTFNIVIDLDMDG